MKKVAFASLLLLCLSNVASAQDPRARLGWYLVQEGGRLVWRWAQGPGPRQSVYKQQNQQLQWELNRQYENQRLLEAAQRRYEVARARENQLLRMAGYAEYHNLPDWQIDRIHQALAAARYERARADLEVKIRSGQVSYGAGVPSSEEWLRGTVYNAQQRLESAERRSAEAADRIRDAADRQRDAYDRYQDSRSGMRDPSRMVDSFREGVQALKDYGRATNDKVNAIVDKTYADHDRRVERGNAAREARESNNVRESRDWRDNKP